MRKIFVLLMLFTLSYSLYAKGTTEKVGDVLFVAIPLSAYAGTFYMNDKDGQYEFYKAYGTTIATTLLLKYTVREKRPDTNERDSFPSGHTSSAFSGASFIHLRYGLKYAVLPYIGAIYTGYSRIKSNRHHHIDVYAGAVIGVLSSWYFVTPYKNLNIEPIVENNYKGLKLSYRF